MTRLENVSQIEQKSLQVEPRKEILKKMTRELRIYDCGTYFVGKYYWRHYQQLIKYYPETQEEIQDLKNALKRLEKEVMGGYNQQLTLFICEKLLEELN